MRANVLSRDGAGNGRVADQQVGRTAGAGIEQVAGQLAAEFDGVVDADVVEQVVRAARRDLEGDVPAGALPELVHRLAKQRLRSSEHGDDD